MKYKCLGKYALIKCINIMNREKKRYDHKLYDEGFVYKQYIYSDPSTFTVLLPPPNRTGDLHLGHALNSIIQDTLVKYENETQNVLFIPGTDHGGIATQSVVKRNLPNDVSNNELYQKITEFADNKHSNIISQLVSMGINADFSKEQYTMSDKYKGIVREYFSKLYNDGLVYRGFYPVNYCTHCQTALSDDELVMEEITNALYYIKYVNTANPANYIEVATTRPETIFADSAIACCDKLYQKYPSSEYYVPLINKAIPLIADNSVSDSYGSGYMKITCAHSKHDYNIGQPLGLPLINVIRTNGKMINTIPELNGLTVQEARKKVVGILYENGLISKKTRTNSIIPKCYRCSNIVETIADTQWFIKMDSLVKLTKENISKISFYPSSVESTLSHWLNKCTDWCISRQIVWGHTIPIHYCQFCGAAYLDTITKCESCSSSEFTHESSVLDTWFSSALWPIGCFESEYEREKFLPTSLLVTGNDIIFFWVLRMIMFTLYFRNTLPFYKVYAHGIVRDGNGHKMSKTKGNVVDPRKILSVYGSDILRFGLLYDLNEGYDVRLSDENWVIAKRFLSKLFNMLELIKMLIDKYNSSGIISTSELTKFDMWIYKKYKLLENTVSVNISNFKFGVVSKSFYDFIFNDYCSIYLEYCKRNVESVPQLCHITELLLTKLYPFVPHFVDHAKKNIQFINSDAFVNITNIEDSGMEFLIMLVYTLREQKLLDHIILNVSNDYVELYEKYIDTLCSMCYVDKSKIKHM